MFMVQGFDVPTSACSLEVPTQWNSRVLVQSFRAVNRAKQASLFVWAGLCILQETKQLLSNVET